MISVLRSLSAWLLLALIFLAMTGALLAVRIGIRSHDRRSRIARACTEQFVSLYLRLSPLYRVNFHGLHHLPAGPCVVVANHESGIDGPCLMHLGTCARFLAANWMFRAPILGFVMRICDHVPVSRREQSPSALEAATEALRSGETVAVFPEGEYAAGALKAFHRGAFVAAREAEVPIVPVRITGSGRAWRPGTWIVNGVNALDVELLAPITVTEVRSSPLEELIERTQNALGTPDSQCEGSIRARTFTPRTEDPRTSRSRRGPRTSDRENSSDRSTR